MLMLLLDTSTEQGIVALVETQIGGAALTSYPLTLGPGCPQTIHLCIESCLEGSGVVWSQIGCIAVVSGPGSYTGLRAGAAIAQGLAFSLDLPIAPICSLSGFTPSNHEGKFAALIDARIAGAYVKFGIQEKTGCRFTSKAKILPLEQFASEMSAVPLLVTTKNSKLQGKLKAHFPTISWQFEERDPCLAALTREAQKALAEGYLCKPETFTLNYLREDSF